MGFGTWHALYAIRRVIGKVMQSVGLIMYYRLIWIIDINLCIYVWIKYKHGLVLVTCM